MDWVTVALYASIVFMGWLNIYAVTYDQNAEISIFSLQLNSGRQLLFIAGAVIIIMGILIMDMRFYETFRLCHLWFHYVFVAPGADHW